VEKRQATADGQLACNSMVSEQLQAAGKTLKNQKPGLDKGRRRVLYKHMLIRLFVSAQEKGGY
jgi:hypothetical protein